MTVKVPLANITDYVEGKLDQFARALVIEVDAAVKEGNPVDTGRMAASWMIGKDGDTSGEPKPEGDYSGIQPPKGTNYQADGGEKIGHTYSIHNNLPYAEVICYTDHSKKADAGWFELIAKDASREAPKIYDRIVRKD